MILFKGNKIIPAPFFSAQKEYQRGNDGTVVGSIWNITLNGELISYKGSPSSDGTFWTNTGEPADEVIADDARFATLMRKKEALRDLFSSKNDGGLLEIQPLDGSAPVKCNPRIISIAFERQSQDPMYNRLAYSIRLEADVLHIVGNENEESEDLQNYKISSASEEWNLETEDPDTQTYRISHRIAAVGKPYYTLDGVLEKPAWEHAQSYVLDKLGVGLQSQFMVGSGVLNLDTHSAYNYVRSQTVNETNGEFSVTETWLAFNGDYPALDDYTVESRVSAENGLTTVAVNGTVRGLETRNPTNWTLQTSKYDNAKSYFNNIVGSLHSRAATISEINNLNPTPASTSIGRNSVAGTISYNYEFNTRGGPIFAGALSELYQESYDNPTDVFASIPVIGRALGPVLQDVGTTTGRRKRLSVSLVFSGYTYGGSLPVKPDTDSLIVSFAPIASVVALSEDQETWDYNTGRYTRNVGWTYEP